VSDLATVETISVDALLQRVRAMRVAGYRLVQISAARLPESMELTYSFDLDYRLASLRLNLPLTEMRVPSVCDIFPCVLLYENEIHDLFGVEVGGMAVDFHGNLYKTTIPFPFGCTKAPCGTAVSKQTAESK
jgi:ech hydrogenase subunit D